MRFQYAQGVRELAPAVEGKPTIAASTASGLDPGEHASAVAPNFNRGGQIPPLPLADAEDAEARSRAWLRRRLGPVRW
jgi:hypothetical protein